MSDSNGSLLVPRSAIPSVPDWVYSPESFIRRLFVRFMLGMIAGFVYTVRDVILLFFGTIADAFQDAGNAVRSAFASVGTPVVDAVTLIQTMVADGAAALGPLGPVFVVAVAVAIIVGVWWLIQALISLMPGLSTLKSIV